MSREIHLNCSFGTRITTEIVRVHDLNDISHLLYKLLTPPRALSIPLKSRVSSNKLTTLPSLHSTGILTRMLFTSISLVN